MRAQRQFCLPTTVTFRSHTNERGKVVAHALDFDLVTSGDTLESAMEKLEVSVKVYIEHGIMNNLTALIPCPAPDEYWPSSVDQLELRFLAPIEIDDTRMFVLNARPMPTNNNETRELIDVAR